MTTTELVSTSISLISLCVAVSAIYLGHFRDPNIEVKLGPDVHLYHPLDGGTAIYLPFLVANNSPTRGAVHQIVIQVSTPSGKQYYSRWQEEADIKQRTWEYSTLGRVKPFTIGGHETVSKIYWFWFPETNSPLLFETGEYQVAAHIWTKNKQKPDAVFLEKFIITQEVEKILADYRERKDPRTRFVYFKRRNLISAVTENGKLPPPWESGNFLP